MSAILQALSETKAGTRSRSSMRRSGWGRAVGAVGDAPLFSVKGARAVVRTVLFAGVTSAEGALATGDEGAGAGRSRGS
ncbi:MAG: hypothetical protein R3F14_31655 [Polyangiaceae bacterium]